MSLRRDENVDGQTRSPAMTDHYVDLAAYAAILVELATAPA